MQRREVYVVAATRGRSYWDVASRREMQPDEHWIVNRKRPLRDAMRRREHGSWHESSTLSSIFLDIVRGSCPLAVPLRFDGITSSYQATPSEFVKTSGSSARELSVTGGGCDQASTQRCAKMARADVWPQQASVREFFVREKKRWRGQL